MRIAYAFFLTFLGAWVIMKSSGTPAPPPVAGSVSEYHAEDIPLQAQDRAPGLAAAKPAVSAGLAPDPRLEKISNLSRIVFNTPEKLAALRTLLTDAQLRRDIRRELNDPSTYKGEAFNRKLRFLDAMYEGLKFPERNINRRYFDLATDILSDAPPASYDGNPELQRQFVADQTEIAIALLKAFPERATGIEAETKDRNANSVAAFNQARRLMNTYEVAL